MTDISNGRATRRKRSSAARRMRGSGARGSAHTRPVSRSLMNCDFFHETISRSRSNLILNLIIF